MSAQNNGGPAFPTNPGMMAKDGMTLRDYFAAKAMQGLMSQSHQGPKDWESIGHGWGEDCANDLNAHRTAVARTLASFSYAIADSMLAAREAS